MLPAVPQAEHLDDDESPAQIKLRKQMSSGDKSHVFVMSLNKTVGSRDDFSLSCSGLAEGRSRYGTDFKHASPDFKRAPRQSSSLVKHSNAEPSKKRIT